MKCDRSDVSARGKKEGGRCCTRDIYIAFSDMVGWTGCKADVS